MSRLESAIRRFEAQRDCINWAADHIAGLPGVVIELGLGNGRTWDHMREKLPDREIFVFERKIAAHPDCIPDEAHIFLGDLREMLPHAAARLGRSAILVHSDIGTGDSEWNRKLAAEFSPLLEPLMLPGGIILSDQPMVCPRWTEITPLETVSPERYHIYST